MINFRKRFWNGRLKVAKRKEPSRLSEGKKFHKKVQDDWLNNATGEILPEHNTKLTNGRKGRIDIFVVDKGSHVALAEIKDSDWDAMKPEAVKRNIRRQIKQVWKYIYPQIEMNKEVSTGIIFSRRPKNKERMKLIEDMFWEEGIPVVWDDETTEERKARAEQEKLEEGK